MHLSQLSFFVLPAIANIVIPIILMFLKKDQILDVEFHAKRIINFQLSMLVYSLSSVVMIIFFMPFWILLILIFFYIYFPVKNAIRASKGEAIDYPLTINFIK